MALNYLTRGLTLHILHLALGLLLFLIVCGKKQYRLDRLDFFLFLPAINYTLEFIHS